MNLIDKKLKNNIRETCFLQLFSIFIAGLWYELYNFAVPKQIFGNISFNVLFVTVTRITPSNQNNFLSTKIFNYSGKTKSLPGAL